jgi:hypothetical protein
MTLKKYSKKPGVCAENHVRAVVGQPSAQRWLDITLHFSADYQGFFLSTPKKYSNSPPKIPNLHEVVA